VKPPLQHAPPPGMNSPVFHVKLASRVPVPVYDGESPNWLMLNEIEQLVRRGKSDWALKSGVLDRRLQREMMGRCLHCETPHTRPSRSALSMTLTGQESIEDGP